MSADQRISDSAVIALAEAGRDLVLITGRDGRVLFANRRAGERLGAAAGRPAGEFITQEDRERMLQLLAQTAAQQTPHDFAARFVHQPTLAPVALAGTVVPLSPAAADDAAVAVVAAERDAEADAFGASAVTLTRLTETFAGVVGHDLRNPLHAILTSAQVALPLTEAPAAREALARILSSGARMQRMIDQLLDLTRIRVGSGIPLYPADADLRALASQVVAEIAVAHPDVAVDLAISGDTRGTWDTDRILQAMSNLVGNAAQHGAAGSRVSVTVDGTRSDHVVVSVHNAGSIPADLLPILFSPFRISHHKRQRSTGLGLGLYVTRQIALAHGGDVEVSSADAGTTFRLRLPRAALVSQASAALSGLGDDEPAAARLAQPPRQTSITARLFGAVPLHERAPQAYWRLFERYSAVLAGALDRQTYKADPASALAGATDVTLELRAIAEQLGTLGAGAREVAELHARALRRRTQDATIARAQALTAEGRLISFELMGHLLSFYRRRAGIGGELE